MDDFDFTYQDRHSFFEEGAKKGKAMAEETSIQDVEAEAYQFGLEFAEQLGTYEAYIQVYDRLNIHEELPLLKVHDIVCQMKNIIKKIDFTNLSILKEEREELRRHFQVFKAMLSIKGGMERKMQQGLDF